MLLEITQIDKKSTFGEEDRITFHIWKRTPKGFKYVPTAIIGDNPNFPTKLLNKGQYRNTPAAKNYILVDRDEIQFQHYGNTFLANWQRPIPLVLDKLILSPATIVFKTYGDIRSHHLILDYPSGAKYEVYYNAIDSFLTFIYNSSQYMGSGVDGLFLRDAYIEMNFPEYTIDSEH